MEICIIPNRHRDSRDRHTDHSRTNGFFSGLLKDRKRKIDAHKSKVIEIFKKWEKEVSSEPLSILEKCFPTFVPFYLKISGHIIKLDPHMSALSHLNDSSYRNIMLTYNTMKEKELVHNQSVSEYFKHTIPKIWLDIKTQANIWEVNEVADLIRQERVDEMTKEGIKMGALEQGVGLYTSNLLEYLSKRSLTDQDEDLEIVDYKGPVVEISEGVPGRWTFYLLKSEKYLPDSRNENGQITLRVIAKSVATAIKSIEILKGILLNDEFREITKTLKEFDNEVNEIQKLYSDFIGEICKIVDKYPTIELKGKCEVEREMRFLK